MTPLQRPVAGIVLLEDAVIHGEACVRQQNCNQDVRLSLPQIGSCNIAEPTRTQTLFLFDSHGLESASSRLVASCSVSWGSCSQTSGGTDSRKEKPSFRVIVNQLEIGLWNRLLTSQCAMFCFNSNDVTDMRPRSRGEITTTVGVSSRGLTLMKLVAAEYCLRPEWENSQAIVTE